MIIVLLIFLIYMTLSFLITAALVYGICWAFAIVFTWKIALGVWLIFLLINEITVKVSTN